VAEQDWSEHRGQVYFTGCAGVCEGQNAQSFVVEVEGNGATSVRSSGGFMIIGRNRSIDRGKYSVTA